MTGITIRDKCNYSSRQVLQFTTLLHFTTEQSYLKQWELYCGEQKIDPLSVSVIIQGVNFLSELYKKHQRSYSAVNTARSGL